MFSIPDPLHPAVVHFPIALLLVGALLSLLAVIFRHWALPTALILVLGAAGAIVAVETGERAEHDAGKIVGQAHDLLELHEHAAERTRNLAIVTSLIAVVGLFATKIPLLRRILAGITAVGALITAYQVVQTGHYGGQIVYKHAVGVKVSPSPSAKPPQNKKD